MPPPHGRTLWGFLHPSHFKQMTFPSYSSEKVDIAQWKPSSPFFGISKSPFLTFPSFFPPIFTCRYLLTTQRVLNSGDRCVWCGHRTRQTPLPGPVGPGAKGGRGTCQLHSAVPPSWHVL